jgi:hypothetical protein
MRKILAVVLTVLQLGFLGGMIGYQKTAERHMATDAVEYEFAADGSFWIWGNERSLRLEIRKKGTVSFSDRYWAIETDSDGLSYVRRTDIRPLDGAYIDADGHEDTYLYGSLEKNLHVRRSFEETFFPGLQNQYIEQFIEDYGEEPDDADMWYGTDDINDPAFSHTFTIKAKVWKGAVEITDYLMDGRSIKEYIVYVND